MERGMMGNYHVPCGAGEKPEITSNAYLLLTYVKDGIAAVIPFFFFNKLSRLA
jgi:hypothetical protein